MGVPDALGPVDIVVSPEPTDDELAAIVAAYRELWPRLVEQEQPHVSERWRFSGRWWHGTARGIR